jgi:cell filamentation protein
VNGHRYAAGEFAQLARENHLRGLARHEFAQRLAYYHAKIDEMHPFRAGNGHAQRAFLRQLGHDAGYDLDWTMVEAEDHTNAAIAAHEGDLEPLQRILNAITKTTRG